MVDGTLIPPAFYLLSKERVSSIERRTTHQHPDGGQKDNFKKLGRLHAIRAFGDKMDKETWKGTDYEERVLFMGLVADKHVDVFGADRCNSKWPIRSLGMQYLKNKAQTWIFISADSWNEINCLVKFINGVLIVFLFLHYYNFAENGI